MNSEPELYSSPTQLKASARWLRTHLPLRVVTSELICILPGTISRNLICLPLMEAYVCVCVCVKGMCSVVCVCFRVCVYV